MKLCSQKYVGQNRSDHQKDRVGSYCRQLIAITRVMIFGVKHSVSHLGENGQFLLRTTVGGTVSLHTRIDEKALTCTGLTVDVLPLSIDEANPTFSAGNDDAFSRWGHHTYGSITEITGTRDLLYAMWTLKN